MEVNTTHHPVPRNSGSNASNRPSKQKIMKLKDELSPAPSPLAENEQFVRVKQLKDSYDLAIVRMNEMNQATSTNMYVKIHGQKASKLYSALSSLIYASIAVAKVDGLEDFVRQTAISLPTTMIDLEEWEFVLAAARECREQTILKSLQQPVSSLVQAGHGSNAGSTPHANPHIHPTHPRYLQELKKKLSLLEFLAVNPIRNTRDEVTLLRQGIVEELNVYQNDLTQAMNIIFYITQKLRDMQNADLNAQKVTHLKSQLHELMREMEGKVAEADDLLQQTTQSYENKLNNMQHTHENVVFTWEKKYNDLLTSSTSQIAAQEQSIAALSHKLQQADALLSAATQSNEENQRKLAQRNVEYEQLEAAKRRQYQDFHSTLINTQAESCGNAAIEQAVRSIVHHDEVRRQQVVIANCEKQCSSLEQHVQKLQKDVQDQQKQGGDLTQTVQHLQAEQAHLTQAKSELEKEKSHLSEMVSKLTENMSALESKSTTESALLESQLAARNEELKALQVAVEQLQAEKNTLQHNETELQHLVEDLKKQSMESYAKQDEGAQQLLAKIKICQEELKQQEGTIQQLQAELNAANDAVAEARAETAAAASIAAVSSSSPSSEGPAESKTSSVADQALLKKCEHHIEHLIQQLQEEQNMSAKLMSLLNESEKQLKLTQMDLVTPKAAVAVPAQTAVVSEVATDASAAAASPLVAPVVTTVVVNLADEEKQVFEGKVRELSRQVDDKNQEIDVLKGYYDRVNLLLRSEVDSQTNEILSLKDKVKLLEDNKAAKKKNVGFSEALLQVNYIKDDPSADAGPKVEAVEDKPKVMFVEATAPEVVVAIAQPEPEPEPTVVEEEKVAATVHVEETVIEVPAPAEEKQVSPRGPPAAAAPAASSPRPGSATADNAELFTPRTAAHYEAARVALDYIKGGVQQLQTHQHDASVDPEHFNMAPDRTDAPQDETDQSSQQEQTEDDGSIASAATNPTFTIPAQDELSYAEPKADDSTPFPMITVSKPRKPLDGDSEEDNEDEVSVLTVPVVVSSKSVDEAKKDKKEDATAAAAAEPAPVEVAAASSSTKKPLAMATVALQYMGATKIQKLMRAFLARKRVERVRIEQLAHANGVLVACEGTKQGETGWYKAQDQLFYFCRDDRKADEFLLLCGPLSRELYDIAGDELTQLIQQSSSSWQDTLDQGSINTNSVESLSAASLPVSNKKKAQLLRRLPRSIPIDRLGLHATRIQIETLLDDLKVRDEHIAQIEDELANLKITVFTAQADMIEKQRKQLLEYQSSYNALKKDNEQLKYQLRNGTDFSQVMMTKIANIPDHMKKSFVKLTSVARGYLSRRRVERIRKFKLAESTGVLVAMGRTKQGDSGWYIGPQGNIFYFVLKEGKWIYTAGPLTEEDFKLTNLESKSFAKKAADGKVLTRCAFNIAGHHGALLNSGELYIANGTGKLILGLPIDDVVSDLSEQQQLDGIQTNSLHGASLSFNSSLVSKLDESMDSLDGGSLILPTIDK